MCCPDCRSSPLLRKRFAEKARIRAAHLPLGQLAGGPVDAQLPAALRLQRRDFVPLQRQAVVYTSSDPDKSRQDNSPFKAATLALEPCCEQSVCRGKRQLCVGSPVASAKQHWYVNIQITMKHARCWLPSACNCDGRVTDEAGPTTVMSFSHSHTPL